MGRNDNWREWICDGCGLAHSAVDLSPGEEARCGRCCATLEAQPLSGPQSGLAWTLAALGFFLAAALTPVLKVSKAGMTGQASILVAQRGLEDFGMPLLGILTGALVIWLPLVALLLLLLANLSVLFSWRWRGLYPAVRLLLFARQWSMTEVFLLAVLVAFLKVGDLAETVPGPGIWFLAGGAFCLITALQRIDRDNLPTRITGLQQERPRPSSVSGSIALLLAALILLVPANLLPIMELSLPQGTHSSTIIGGVRSLADGGMWGIAAIVFTASVLVPFAKIAGLSWLIWLSRRQAGTLAAMRLHRFIEFIGRWSMLDIFLVALLAGLIRFGNLAQVRPGPAAPAFAAAVILTVLAVQLFDTRLLWQQPVRTQSAP